MRRGDALITTQNIFDILYGVADKVNETAIPEEAFSYIRMRMKAKEIVLLEAQDTAHLHAMYVLDASMIESVETIDDIGWELLYNGVSKREEIPLSFARGLSYKLSTDLLNNKIECKVDEGEIQNNQRILIGIVFDGVKKGFWELEDAKTFADKKCPDIPYFDKEQWIQSLSTHFGGHVMEDMADAVIPTGGDDVFIL
tara:strand:- start:3038 stop:3631 length:594 start_codon:yes stop_codon:yes gene_type:complete